MKSFSLNEGRTGNFTAAMVCTKVKIIRESVQHFVLLQSDCRSSFMTWLHTSDLRQEESPLAWDNPNCYISATFFCCCHALALFMLDCICICEQTSTGWYKLFSLWFNPTLYSSQEELCAYIIYECKKMDKHTHL